MSSTRTTGKRVVRTQTKSWQVPHCTRCLAHQRAAREYYRFSTSTIHGSWVVGLIGAAATGFIFFIFLLASPKLAIVLAALAGAATVGVVVATFKKFHQLYLGNSAVKRRRKQELGKRLDSLLCPTCAETENWAAAYEGWQGTVHTFWFASADFARLFRASNPKKCLSDGGIHY